MIVQRMDTFKKFSFDIFYRLKKICKKKPALITFYNQLKKIADSICMKIHILWEKPSILFAFYDLEVSAASYDIVQFLVLADTERKKQKLQSMAVVLVPGTVKGFSEGSFTWYNTHSITRDNDINYLNWRLKQILIPCCYLIPSCVQIMQMGSRKEAHSILKRINKKNIFPNYYSICKPISIFSDPINKNPYSKKECSSSIKPSPSACRFIKQWLEKSNIQDKKIITITLREASYEITRNSDINEWIKFVESLNPGLYYPVFIRDTEVAIEPDSINPLPSLVLHEVSFNVELRAALYHMSYLNLFTSSGPANLGWFNSECRFIIFKLISSGSPIATCEHLEAIGIPYGSQPDFFTKFQKLVWAEDTFEIINEEFQIMCEKIESSH